MIHTMVVGLTEFPEGGGWSMTCNERKGENLPTIVFFVYRED